MSDHEAGPDPVGNSSDELGVFPAGVGFRIFFLVMVCLATILMFQSMTFLVLLTALGVIAVVAPTWVAGAGLADIALWSLWIALLRVLLDSLDFLVQERSLILEFIRHGRADFTRPAKSKLHGALVAGAMTGLAGAVVFALYMPDLHSTLTLTGVSIGAGAASVYAWTLGRWAVRLLRRRSPKRWASG